MVDFNASYDDVQDSSFDALPEGSYEAALIGADIKDYKSGVGQFVNLQFAIVKGEYTGRILFHMAHLSHPNQKCNDIGKAEIKKLAKACGITQGRLDTDLYLNKPVLIRVVQEAGYKDPDEKVNKIKAFKALSMSRSVSEQARSVASDEQLTF